jgi:hypothetical protein
MKEAARSTAALACLPSKEELGTAYSDLRVRIDQIVAQAQAGGSLAIALQGLNALRQSLDSLARIAGHDRLVTSQVTVDVSVNVTAAVQTVIAAIGLNPSHQVIKKLEKIVDAD